jgi:hypothetical protein
MVLRRPLIIVSFVAAVIVTVALLASVRLDNSAPTPRAGQSDRPTPSPVAEGLHAHLSPTYAGPAYDPTVARSPTRDKPQSKLWYHDGLWWAVLFDNEHLVFTIWWLDSTSHAWVNTGTLVEDRPFARQDVHWDGESLVTASHGSDQASARHALQIRRFAYEPESRSWIPAPNFPVQVTDRGVEAASLTRDGAGRLWAAFILDQRVTTVTAEPGDLRWSPPNPLPLPNAEVAADQAAVVPLGDDVGLMWSNQVEDGVYFTVHRGDAPLGEWEPVEAVLSGLDTADDHISVRSLEGPGGMWVYAVVKTSLDEAPRPNALGAQVLFLVRGPDGSWSEHVFGRIEDHHTRPILVLDRERRAAYVFATSPFDGGMIYMKQTGLDRINFPVGLGEPVITGEGDPKINNATSTDQPVDAASGLVLLAADDTIGSYLHAELGLEPHSSEPVPAVSTRTPFVALTFDGLPPGLDVLTQRFTVAPAGVTAAVQELDGAMVTQVISGDGEPARLCRRFVPAATGTLSVSTLVRIAHAPAGDAPILAVRGGGQEVTGLRILANGTWAHRVGQERVTSTARWASGTWMRLSVTIDLAARTYGFEVTGPQGDPVLAVADLPWQAQPPEIDEVCIQAPRADGTGEFWVDDLSVLHEEAS